MDMDPYIAHQLSMVSLDEVQEENTAAVQLTPRNGRVVLAAGTHRTVLNAMIWF